MSDILLKNVQISGGPDEGIDLLIREGHIAAMGKNLQSEKGLAEKDCKGAWVSPGWMDVGVECCDPGYEHREDLLSAAAAAASGGFTALACEPNTHPAIHGKAELRYIIGKMAHNPVHFYPLGAVSYNVEGKDMAELYDLYDSGAIAFSDGPKGVQDAGLLLRALQYARAFNGLIIDRPMERSLSSGGQMHEGYQSTALGLKGIPVLAEEIAILRDLKLLEYSEGRLHLHMISTAQSVELVRVAKKAGLPVTCSVAVANLAFTDAALADFDSNYKVMPPLRSESDRQALITGLKDGTIDFICSNHSPWDTEAKNLEFTYAKFGMIGMETAFSLCYATLEEQIPLPQMVRLWSEGPRKVLGISMPEIKAGAAAELTIFDPKMAWTPQWSDMRSKSRNTPMVGQTLKGRVLGIVSKRQNVWNF